MPDKRLGVTPEEIFADVYVLRAAMMSIAHHLGQSERVKQDMISVRDNFFDEFKQENPDQKDLGLIVKSFESAFDKMIQSLTSE